MVSSDPEKSSKIVFHNINRRGKDEYVWIAVHWSLHVPQRSFGERSLTDNSAHSDVMIRGKEKEERASDQAHNDISESAKFDGQRNPI